MTRPGHTNMVPPVPFTRNVGRGAGGHGAALKPECRESLVSFLLGDAPEVSIMPRLVDVQTGWVDAAHKIRILIWTAILLAGILLFRSSVLANAGLGWRWPILPAAVIVVFLFAFFAY